MTDPNALNRMVRRYLTDLESALSDLPPAQRQSIVEEIADHIREARSKLGADDEAGLRQILDRLGNVNEIREAAGGHAVPTTRKIDRFVPWILLFGGFVFAFGWIAGVILLWLSPTWRVGDKLLGTLVVPGGLSLFVLLAGLVFNVPPPLVWVVVFFVVGMAATVATAVHLDRVRRCASRA